MNILPMYYCYGKGCGESDILRLFGIGTGGRRYLVEWTMCSILHGLCGTGCDLPLVMTTNAANYYQPSNMA